MALVYKRSSTYALHAAYQAAAARLSTGAAGAVSRHLQRFLALFDGVRGGEDHSIPSEENARHRPGSVFDARYKGLAAQATYIDAGICRRARMR